MCVCLGGIFLTGVGGLVPELLIGVASHPLQLTHSILSYCVSKTVQGLKQ